MESYNIQAPSKAKMAELQAIMTKMPFEVCCVTVLPEFEHLSTVPLSNDTVSRRIHDLASYVKQELVTRLQNTRFALQMDESTDVAGLAILLVIVRYPYKSSFEEDMLMCSSLLTNTTGEEIFNKINIFFEEHNLSWNNCIDICTDGAKAMTGLGYKDFVNSKLYGRDVISLLRINDRACNENVEFLSSMPAYEPTPVITKNGIDYTNKAYDEKYVDGILGPNPPLLTDLKISTHESFFDPTRLNKQMNLRIQLKSQDVAKSLKAWVLKGALAPTSDFFQIFNKIKSNNITYVREDFD
ncbi:unnamed protein product [Chilo suppressalis]|uniref:DUF4371 domain-containing protein n=1 Tax=Chilo suppressalis TaxID=168631 RepID=A0ABN8B487_CHISP|nr:unnamed protein product [Chilo suppressalis]